MGELKDAAKARTRGRSPRGPASAKRIEANRRNALRSTGPKTSRGKRASRWNALKHGLLAQEAIVRIGDKKENATQFRQLLERLVEELQPVGALESIAVEKIAVAYWRLRRALRYETGQVYRALETAETRESDRNISAIDDELNRARTEKAPDVNVLRRHPLGLRVLAGLFGHLREELAETGSISDVTLKRLQLRFGNSSLVTLARLIRNENARIPDAEPETPNTLLDQLGGAKETLLNLVDLQEEMIELQAQILGGKHESGIEAEQAISAIPERDAVELLWRYETMLERQLYRAIDQLDRLQRRRQGQPVPAPINVDVSAAIGFTKQTHDLGRGVLPRKPRIIEHGEEANSADQRP